MFAKLFGEPNPSKLENLLKESYENKLKRYDLMKEFLSSSVYFKGTIKGKEIFLNYHENSLLAFTSIDSLQKAQQVKRDYFLGLVHEVLEVIPAGIRLLLNTGPNYGKEFSTDELRFLKDGKIPPDLTQVYQMRSGQKFSIFKPREVPQKLVDSLFERMKKCENIEKAYLAEILLLNGEKPNLVVGIKVYDAATFEKDIVSIMEAVKGAISFNEFVDFIQVFENNTSEIANFMTKETKPFFDREYLS